MKSNGDNSKRVAAVQDMRRSSASARHVVKARKGTRRDKITRELRTYR